MRQLKIVPQITKRETQALEKYLQDIGAISLITAEEEVALAKRIQQGDQQAKEELIKANLRFVVSVAKQYQNKGLPLSDIISIGNMGLIKAAERFDFTRGFKFISYAVWWIRQSILQVSSEYSTAMHRSLSLLANNTKLNKAKAAFAQEHHRSPTAEELAHMMDMPVKDVTFITQTFKKHLSIDAPFSEEEEGTLLDVLEASPEYAPDTHLINESLQQEIMDLFEELTPRQQEVITCYFGIGTGSPMTLEEIGKKLNLTRERARQIKERTLTLLRKNPRYRHLKVYLD